jgi:LytS/YehU family sensor histidine kinase
MAGITVTWMFQIEWAWAAGIAAHVIFLARAQSHQMSERIRRHQEMDLHSARLEIELLKKNIQPHFLLNSLNSIIAWLEEEPKTAAKLVNALADELGMLLRISSLKTISLEEEIRLCRIHLQVMGLRQDKTYSLEHTGVMGDERIPPMVLHTLVENGLTHGYVGKSNGTFLLRREDFPESVRYSLFNDGVPREKKEKKAEGTGLRYVRTRLEEVFPGRWRLESRSVENGWEVTLDIKRENK